MNCDLNCSACPFASRECSNDKGFVVGVVGTALDSGFLDFTESPVISVAFRGYEIRFVNFTTDTYHIGRKLLSLKPDVVLDIVDSTDLESSLDLTSRLVDLDLKTVLVFSRYDRFLQSHHSIDSAKFSEMVGIPSVTVGEPDDSSRSRLFSAIADIHEQASDCRKHVHVPYGADLDSAADEIASAISASMTAGSGIHDRYIAVRLLEDPEYIYPAIRDREGFVEIAALAAAKSRILERQYGEPVSDLVAKARFGFVRGALHETVSHSHAHSEHRLAERIDSLLTSRLFGFPLLLLTLFAVFGATFKLGAYPQHWIESGVSRLSLAVRSAVDTGWLGSLLADGIIQGVGAVLAFLPNIILMFLFLSILEDSGYMARAAFLMDKLMHKVGLHGRSFVPMLLGFGCNVPAIMYARSIEDKRDRTLTMLMIPYMSCSARLPVYLLLVSAFFSGYKALVMISIYLLGIVLSVGFAFLMKRTRHFRKEESDYVSELPQFRIPAWRNTLSHVAERSADYLKKISTVILAASVIIWALEYFPADRTQGGAKKDESCLAMVGKAVEPVTRPLGFDWKMNVCLITGLPAKEAIVSTMGILYHEPDEGALVQTLRTSSGMTPANALSFMAFVLLYFPCIATIATLRREVGKKWAAFSVAHSLVLAWLVSFVIFALFSL